MRHCLLVFTFLLITTFVFAQCPQSVKITSSNPTICSGNKVTLTATPSGGSAPYTYTWSTGETGQSIDVNKEGTYTVTVTKSGCSPVSSSINIKVSPTPDAPTAAPQVVCYNTPATLKATAPGGLYQWYDSSGAFLISGDTYTTPNLTSGRIYFVQTTVNGCTSARTQVNVSISSKPTITGQPVCAGNRANITADGGDTYKWYPTSDATGTPLSTDATYTTPVLTQNTTYYVVATNNGCTSAPTPYTQVVNLPPQKPTVADATPSVCSGSRANLHANDATGVFAWFDVATGGTPLIYSPDFTTPPLTTKTTYYVQNSLNGCESERTKVVVTVNPIPSAPAPQSLSTCGGTPVTIKMPPIAGVTYEWYDIPSGGTAITSGNNFITPILNNSTNYYVEAVNTGGCPSDRIKIEILINAAPSAPAVSGQTICYNTSAVLTPTGPGSTYKWYNTATATVAIKTGAPFTTPLLKATTTYYVETTIAGCTSSRVPVTVTVSPAITPPLASGTSACSGDPATLTATGGAGTYGWYAAKTGGSALATGQTFLTPPITANITYYVQISNDDCTSTRTAVLVKVNTIPAAPTAANKNACPGTQTTLTASVAAGSVDWFASASGGTSLHNGKTFLTPVLNATTTYYVQNTIGTCVSSRTPVTVTISSPNEPQFQYPTGSICVAGANVVPVINNPQGGTFTSSPAGLVFVSTTTGEINVAASAVGNYVITFHGIGTCVVPETATFSIISSANAQFSYQPGYCQDDVNPLPTHNTGASGGVFSATPAGLVFVNTSTGEIDLKNSQPGAYTITNTIASSGACIGTKATASLTIYQSATVNAGPDQVVASGTPVQLNGSITGAVTSGKWSGGAGSFSNSSAINAVYTPTASETSATLTLTSDDPPGLCGPKTDQVTITFKTSPALPTVKGNNTCMGSSAMLTAIAPGGTYNWYDVPTGGISLATSPIYTTPVLNANAIYYVDVTNSVGVTSAREQIVVTVNSIIPPPVVTGKTGICVGETTTLTTNDPTGDYTWYDAPVNGNKLSTTDTYATPGLTSNQTYYVQKKVNNCVSDFTAVPITVSAVPSITSEISGSVCSGNQLSYTITANVPTATFLWSRDAVTGISNPAVSNQSANIINETLVNTGTTAINVKYNITPINGSCSGSTFVYTVVVYPTPQVTSTSTADPICNGTSVNYKITFNTAASFQWSRDAKPGITNAAISGQAGSTIKEALFNTTTAPIVVTYNITSKTSACPGIPFALNITVNPQAMVTSDQTGTACSGVPQSYAITSSIPASTYIWSRDIVNNISNDAVTNQTSPTINESLINTATGAVKVDYIITPIANGCPGTPFTYTVTVNPQIAKPIANGNSPVCVGSTIQLRTTVASKGTYLWTGPGGFQSTKQNPNIVNATKANIGTYSLTIVNGDCSSEASTVDIDVKDPPTAYAGADRVVCIADPTISLTGATIGGGASTGTWTSSGTGRFSPSVAYPTATNYLPTAQDKTNESVILTLTSTDKSDCAPASSTVTITFGPLPAVSAGADQDVCIQTSGVQLDGSTLITSRVQWTTSGSGSFIPSVNQINAVYVPSADDTKNGSVKLVLLALDAGVCDIPTDEMTITFVPPPTVNAGGNRYVLKNRTITLTPTVSDNNVTYLWTPNVDINDNTVKNPVITGNIDRAYVLQVTDSRGCISKDTAFIKVSPLIVVPNTFTPNGDGVNDLWNIEGLVAYTDATVDIFTRYGQKVFHSIGYDKPWDGTYNGQAVPVGVYYYVINTKMFNQVLSGSLTVIR